LRGPERPAEVYAELLRAYQRLLTEAPGLTSLHVDHFLTLAGTMHGRDLFSGGIPACELPAHLRQERARVPLRQRLKERGHALAAARQALESALAAEDGVGIGAALAVADPESAGRCRVDWRRHGEALTLWVGRLWEADDPGET